ncbi:MAG: hypothetical protein R3D84_03500 [Paracoccaceae bacterium]
MIAVALTRIAAEPKGSQATRFLPHTPQSLLADPTLRVMATIEGTPLTEALAPLKPLAALLRRARALEMADLTPIGVTGAPLDEVAHAGLWAGAADEITARLNDVSTGLKDGLRQLKKQTEACFDHWRIAYQILPASRVGGPGKSADDAALRQLCDAINQSLARLAPILPGGEVPMLSAERVDADAAAREAELASLMTTLNARLDAARARLAEGGVAATDASSLTAQRGRLRAGVDALRLLLGRPQFPIVPRFAPMPGLLAPLGPAQSIPVGLDIWPRLRSRIGPLLALDGLGKGDPYALRMGRDHGESASADDPRSEEDAPRKHVFARLIGTASALSFTSGFAGFVIDEWTETRPARMQPSALAINYDAPQAEPQNVILLGVPASLDARDWDEAAAARLMREMIRWMQIRAASTQETLLTRSILPDSNVVADARRNNSFVPRIPVRKTPALKLLPFFSLTEGFHRATADFGFRTSGLTELGGRGGKRRGK